MSDDKSIHKSSFLVVANLKRRKLGTRRRIGGVWFVWTEKGWKLERPIPLDFGAAELRVDHIDFEDMLRVRFEGKTWD